MLLALSACVHPVPPPAPAPVLGPTPAWWQPGAESLPSEGFDDADALVPFSGPAGVEAIRSDGSTAWTAPGQVVWVGALGGRTRLFTMSADAVEERDPATGTVARTWPCACATPSGVTARIEGPALVIELPPHVPQRIGGMPWRWEEQEAARAASEQRGRVFVPLDRDGPAAVHFGVLEAAPAPSSPVEVRFADDALWVFADGSPRFPLPGVTWAAVDRGQVAAQTHAVWRVLDAEDGTTLVEVPLDRCASSPRVVGDAAVCVRVDGSHTQLVGLDLQTGEPRWSRAGPDLPTPSPYPGAGG